jgi:hypothetical protein
MARLRLSSFAVVGALLILLSLDATPLSSATSGTVEAVIVDNGTTYEVIDGAVYRLSSGQLTFMQQIYDPSYLTTNYRTIGTDIYRVDPASGSIFKTFVDFSESFETAPSIKTLIGPTRGWTSFTLQSPAVSTVSAYNALRDSILNGGSYVDNRVEPSTSQKHGGTESLLTYSVSPTAGMETAKASLESSLMYFRKGDTLVYSGWYYIAAGQPFGIADFESSYIESGPGLRIVVDTGGVPRVELKWANKPSFTSISGAKIPTGRWTNIQFIATLSDATDGTVSLWVDGTQVISGTGQTLPLPSAVYDRLEIGITANNGPPTTVYVDDIRLSHTRFF